MSHDQSSAVKHGYRSRRSLNDVVVAFFSVQPNSHPQLNSLLISTFIVVFFVIFLA